MTVDLHGFLPPATIAGIDRYRAGKHNRYGHELSRREAVAQLLEFALAQHQEQPTAKLEARVATLERRSGMPMEWCT